MKELELEILETFVSSTLKKCNIQEIFVFGSIQSYNNLVRIRIEDVRVSNGLNIENKNEAKNDRVFNYQEPINITSNSLNCLNEKIIIEFENEINIQYLRIIQDANDLFQNVKIINKMLSNEMKEYFKYQNRPADSTPVGRIIPK